MTPILLAICDIVTESVIVFVDRFFFKFVWFGWDHLCYDRRRCVCEASGLIHARISAFQMRYQSVCHSWMVLMWARGEVCFGRKVRSERENCLKISDWLGSHLALVPI